MIAYRDMTSDDRAFVVRHWLGSFRTAFTAGMIAMEDWESVMVPQIAKVLARPDVRTVVAYAKAEFPGDTEHCLGFMAADATIAPSIVYYIYVENRERKAGLARDLFRHFGIDPMKPFVYTCKTRVVSELARKIPMAQWKPLIARHPKEQTHADIRHGRK